MPAQAALPPMNSSIHATMHPYAESTSPLWFRRHWLAGAAGILAFPMAQAQPTSNPMGTEAALATRPPGLLPHHERAAPAVPLDKISVLYRRNSPDELARSEPAVQAALRRLEGLLSRSGYQVMSPTAEMLALMEQGPSFALTFAPDAGLTLVVSAQPGRHDSALHHGQTALFALQGQVLVGRRVLSSEDVMGDQYAQTDDGSPLPPPVQRRALEHAAIKAADALGAKTLANLKALSPEKLQAELASQFQPLPPPTAVAGQGPVPPGTPLAPARNRWALIVAVADYARVKPAPQGPWGNLNGPRLDAAQVQRTLKGLGYPDQNVTVLLDQHATSRSVREALKRLVAQVGPDDNVVLFFSCHGCDKHFSPSGYGMPVLSDFSPGDSNNIDFWELQSAVGNLRGRVVWINDTCHSGGAAQRGASVVVSSKGLSVVREVRGPDPELMAQRLGSAADVLIATSSSANEVSWETSTGGVFTQLLLDAVRRTSGRVPLSRLFKDEVHARVVEQSRRICQQLGVCAAHPQQTPRLAFGGRGDQLML
jgi:hypothetical protein